MKRVYIPIAVVVGLIALGAVVPHKDKKTEFTLQRASTQPTASPAVAESTAPPVVETTAPAVVTTTPATAAATAPSDAVDFAMPSFVGMNLQDAQDRVQTYGIFYSVSHDLLGSRMQIVDSNWQVCNQTPLPGTRIKGRAADYEGKFDFGAVKLTENCP